MVVNPLARRKKSDLLKQVKVCITDTSATLSSKGCGVSFPVGHTHYGTIIHASKNERILKMKNSHNFKENHLKGKIIF